MKMRLSKTLALGVVLCGVAGMACADTETYGINLGSGWQGVGYANGGQIFDQIASVPSANGWQSRFNTGNPITHEFNLNIYANDSPAIFDWLAAHLSTPNYTTSGQVAAFDVTKGTGNVLSYTGGYFDNVAFPTLTAGSVGSSYLATSIDTLTTSPASSAGVLSAITPSTLLGWSTGYANVTVSGCTTTGVKVVRSINITDQEYANASFGFSKDCSDLVITIPTGADVNSFNAWLTEANAALDKRSASVTYYDVTGNPIGTLNLGGLSIRGIVATHLYDGPSYGDKDVYMTVESASWTNAPRT